MFYSDCTYYYLICMYVTVYIYPPCMQVTIMYDYVCDVTVYIYRRLIKFSLSRIDALIMIRCAEISSKLTCVVRDL